MIGQQKEKATQTPTKKTPTSKQKEPTSADQSMEGETGETGSRSHYLVAKIYTQNPGSRNLFSIL